MIAHRCAQGQPDLAEIRDGKPVEDSSGLQGKLLGTVAHTLHALYGLMLYGVLISNPALYCARPSAVALTPVSPSLCPWL